MLSSALADDQERARTYRLRRPGWLPALGLGLVKGYAVFLLCFAALDGCGSSGAGGGSPAPASADDLRRLERSFGQAVASVLPGVPIKNVRCPAATTCEVDIDVRGVIAHVVFDLKRDGRTWS